MHQQWRLASAVDITVLGPTSCRRREDQQTAQWAFDLRHAIPLSSVSQVSEQYRADALARFERARAQLATHTYATFRQYRNEAVATLPRSDPADQALNSALCVSAAARFWLLASGEPHPAAKWLLAALRRRDSCVPQAMAAAVDPQLSPADRFDALWQIWQAVDLHASTTTSTGLSWLAPHSYKHREPHKATIRPRLSPTTEFALDNNQLPPATGRHRP